MGESIAGQNARCSGQRQGKVIDFVTRSSSGLGGPHSSAALDGEAGILYGSATISGQFRPSAGRDPRRGPYSTG